MAALRLWSDPVALAFTRRQRLSLPRIRFLAVLASALASGAPAAAQAIDPPPAAAPASRWTLPPPSVAMRSAMLGGTSRMEQVLVAQQAIAPPAPATANVPSDQLAADTPNVFGSVALAVSRTPLDAQWQRVSAAEPVGRWTGAFPALRDDNREALLGEVNRWVNARIAFTDDARLHGQADLWSGAAETLRRGRGDCEDYALTKMQLLAALGFDRRDMYLVVVRDTLRQGDHAVLAVRAGGRFLVLDNLRDGLADAAALPDYRPMIS